MNRVEWAVVAALTLVTIVTLSFAPPGTPPEPTLLTLPSTETATARPTRTETATPTFTPEPTATEARKQRTVVATTPAASPTPSPSPTSTPFPFDTRAELPRYIYIDQAVQHMYVFERGELVRDIPCSAGLPDADKYTPAWSGVVGEYWGTFHAYGLYADEAWYLYKSEGSILIHALPYVWGNGYKVYQDRDALGVRPSSHGCVRISPGDAVWFTAWEPHGVPITVSDPYLESWQAGGQSPG